MYFVYDALDALDRVFDGFSGSRIVRSYHQHGNSRLYVVEHTVVDAVQHVAGLVSAHSQVQRLVGSVILLPDRLKFMQGLFVLTQIVRYGVAY